LYISYVLPSYTVISHIYNLLLSRVVNSREINCLPSPPLPCSPGAWLGCCMRYQRGKCVKTAHSTVVHLTELGRHVGLHNVSRQPAAEEDGRW